MLNELSPVQGARHAKKRLGRGTGSGLGKTSARGQKGQGSRSGGNVRPVFEGGQMPLFQRLPKRGFHNVNRKEYAVVNVEALNVFEDGQVVDELALIQAGLVSKVNDGIKILGDGALEKKLTVKAHKFSAKAEEAIKQAGGTVEVM